MLCNKVFALINEIEFLHETILSSRQEAINELVIVNDKLEIEEILFKNAMVEYEVYLKQSNNDFRTIEPYKTFYLFEEKRSKDNKLDSSFNFLEEFYSTIKYSFHKYSHHPEAVKVRFHSENCLLIILKMQSTKERLIKNYIDYAQYYEEKSEQLKEILIELE